MKNLQRDLGLMPLLFLGLLLCCNKAGAGNSAQAGKAQDLAVDSAASDPRTDAEPEEGIVPPSKITGAFLTCSEAVVDAATAETKANIRCSLLEPDKSLAEVPDADAWKVSGNPPPELKLAPPGSNYHVDLVYQAANQVELIHKVKDSALTVNSPESPSAPTAPEPASVGILLEPTSRLSTVEIMKPKTLQALSAPTRFMRQLNTYGRADLRPDLNNQDFHFYFQKGLSDVRCTSFESVNKPGYFLRHRGSELRLDLYQATTLFKADATFCKRPSRSTRYSTGSSYQTQNYPGVWLVHTAAGKITISSSRETAILDSSVFAIVD